MTQEQLISLGWSIAGWLAAVALPPAFVFGLRWLQAQASLTVTDKRSAVLAELAHVAITAVTAAEQTISANPDKKAAALSFVQTYLNAHSIQLSVREVDAAIESAVFLELHHTGAGVGGAPAVLPERATNGDLRSLASVDATTKLTRPAPSPAEVTERM